MTEEPEGGSAMITLEIFNDLYQFLADIDASSDQVLKNMYFTDSLLNFLREEKKEEEKPAEEVPSTVAEESIPMEEEQEEEMRAEEEEDLSAISCPDIAMDDFKPGDLDDLEKIESVERYCSKQE